ncbi:MAG: helix-turn-helix transcriptional regulator [Armatimonadetes bacterium]|nr:helix-turn-helix transcriptional regulator [Armatimonadota bacterium]
MQKSVFSHEQIILQNLLRQIRLDAGLRQADLAERLGKPQPFVSRFESGEKLLDLPELRQVCQALGLTLIEFVRQYEDTLTNFPHSVSSGGIILKIAE